MLKTILHILRPYFPHNTILDVWRQSQYIFTHLPYRLNPWNKLMDTIVKALQVLSSSEFDTLVDTPCSAGPFINSTADDYVSSNTISKTNVIENLGNFWYACLKPYKNKYSQTCATLLDVCLNDTCLESEVQVGCPSCGRVSCLLWKAQSR